MSAEATLKSEEGLTESDGLSCLDVVKHAVITIISSLKEHDRLALVSFSSCAYLNLGLTNMDKAGKEKATKILKELHTMGSTNLWDGLKTGMNLFHTEIEKSTSSQRIQSVFLLTDGQPNISPPRGNIPEFQKYKNDFDGTCLPAKLNTFGFGYHLDSQLLHNLAREGHGAYAFIPDAALVGTVFINALSNLLSTYAVSIEISLESEGITDADEFCVWGGHAVTKTQTCVNIHIGSIQFGQAKDLIIEVKKDNKKEYNVAVKYTPVGKTSQVLRSSFVMEAVGHDDSDTMTHHLRNQLVAILHKLAIEGNQTELNSFTEELKIFHQKYPTNYHGDLLKDVTGEAVMASEAKNHSRWGRHYLPSLATAHQLQMCNNFKDPGVQHYGGALFGSIRDELDEIFGKLPAPEPSIQPRMRSTMRTSKREKNGKMSMRSYNCSSMPCFHPDSTIRMANSTFMSIKNIKPGDFVHTPINPEGGMSQGARVMCVVRTKCNGRTILTKHCDSGLMITPWHPIKLDQTWMFPIDAPNSSLFYSGSGHVYSLLLDTGHVIEMNGVDSVTLGHGFNGSGDVRAHAFFGSREKIIEHLSATRGWSVGIVNCIGTVRDSVTGLVCGFQEEQLIASHNLVMESRFPKGVVLQS
uniref:VWFA domain-containing protein n=1 Tax=Corethron hystrix TaxID=216773 RepID=A0A7S1BML8_9STRA